MNSLKDKATQDSQVKLRVLYSQIDDTSEDVVILYDVIENYFFQDVDYRLLEPTLPLWMADGGRSAESSISKDEYEKFRQVYKDPISNRIIHWFDVQVILGAFQDRLLAVERHVKEIYSYIPAYNLHSDSEYTACMRGLDDMAMNIHTAINEVFVALASSFDLLTKVIYECSHYDSNNFVSYKRLKSRAEGVLYKKANYGYEELRQDGLLYSEPRCVRTICSFRDEFVHNGSWDYRCAVYYPSIDGEPVEPFVLMPDVDNAGLLVSSGSRNKFYSKGDKINVALPGLLNEVITVLKKTIAELKGVLQKRTMISNIEKATETAQLQMLRNQFVNHKFMLGEQYTDKVLVGDVDLLMPQFLKASPIIAELCRGITLNTNNGNWLLTCGCSAGRPYRMLMFVLLLNETENLRIDYQLAYHLLKEAYLLTDNIYGQLKHSLYPFSLPDYLELLENALPNRNPDELENEEKELYLSLPAKITVYRGMCDAEKSSGRFGISWTLDRDYSLNYVFYKMNEVEGAVGWCAEMHIDKTDIFAVWGEVGKKKEIVINPKKCKDVVFTKVAK